MKASLTVPTVRLASSAPWTASASTCRSPYERGRPQVVTPGKCCRAASAPRRCAPPVRVGLPPTALGASRSVPWLAVARMASPLTEFGVESCRQFVVMAAVAPSSSGMAEHPVTEAPVEQQASRSNGHLTGELIMVWGRLSPGQFQVAEQLRSWPTSAPELTTRAQ
jgi:hypothetical protein